MNISQIIFYTENFDKKITQKVDVILSPKFYWIKKIDIPIKNSFQAKKIAKNIFDIEGEFIFDAVKLNNKYFAVAVPKKLNLKIDKKYINSIHLAQFEFFDYDCLEVNEKFILKKIDDILFCYPNKCDCEKKLSDEINKIKLFSYTINLDTINIDKISLILIGMVFLFINIFFISGIVNYKKEYQNILKNERSLYRYNLPLNDYQLDAIYSNLKEIDKTQKAIRKDLEIFSSTPLKKNEEFIKLVFNNVLYSLEINSSRNFDNYFSKYFVIKTSSSNKVYKAVLEDRNLNE